MKEKQNKQKKSIFGERMVIAMKRKENMNFSKLSELTGIASATLSSYSGGTYQPKNPPINKAIKIAEALDVSMNWICGIDDNDELTIEKLLDELLTILEFSDGGLSTDVDADLIMGTGEYRMTATIPFNSSMFYEFFEEYNKVNEFVHSSICSKEIKESILKTIKNKIISSYVLSPDGKILIKANTSNEENDPFGEEV